MAREDPQINIRMPASLKLRLEEAALELGRSVTAEIVARLEQSFVGPKHPPQIIIRLEALKTGTPSVDMPLGQFFQAMSGTMRELTEAKKAEERAARRAEREANPRQNGPGLSETLDSAPDDAEAAERAAKDVLARRKRKLDLG
ncbi:Arc family DNA-binding protein [Mesorhizobium sp. M7A.F.Ca.ET.027.03.2.1]|uniref:Arc family DNA-binding protein n=1 Tax=Mesorhizobium sp. M7A.F.Ca.ET.027.03.2.1 TaxID=2496656 RepID=UPI000FCCC9D6|nr:Arc family DNA-binding protein [Mesorhizobium sp. M7A.F.Ca.ET.027.03.2.1]RVD64718.1 Arc family DNA-binding protein [Mesorhizobium sp. M7A.F.Ca.ET.027.03.2.1]